MRYNHGEAESIEYYFVLAFFSKYTKIWFVAKESKFLWHEELTKRENVKVLVRVLQKQGSTNVEAKVEKDGK